MRHTLYRVSHLHNHHRQGPFPAAMRQSAYNLAITAEANSEVFASFAPSIWRAKS